MNYKQRIQKVIDFIGEHLDEPLSLEELSDVACFSKYHFHRLFTAHTGLSVKQYVKWLRLNRAASQLAVHPERPIINIALDAGFETHEAFSRSFKKCWGQTPQAFKENPDRSSTWLKPPYSLPNKKEDTPMDVSIKDYPEKRVAVLEHHGHFGGLDKTVQQLVAWCKAQAEDLRPSAGTTFGFAYNDPRHANPDEFHFDIARAIPDSVTVSGDIKERTLPGGRYAMAMHYGALDNIGDTIDMMYKEWLPESGEEPGDFPIVFRYQNFMHEVAETELVTEVTILLK